MVAWQVVGVLAIGLVLGWVAHKFEVSAERERQVWHHGPPPSNVRVLPVAPSPYDREVDGG